MQKQLFNVHGIELRENRYYKDNILAHGVFEVEVDGLLNKIDLDQGTIAVIETVLGQGRVKKTNFHENGAISMTMELLDGIEDGDLISYDLGGNIVHKSTFQRGKQIGEVLNYYHIETIDRFAYAEPNEDGSAKLQFRAYRNINGELDGETLEYYKDGSLKEKVTYKNGVKNGEEIKYSLDKEMIYKRNYINDNLDGEVIEYFSIFSEEGDRVKKDIDGKPILKVKANYSMGILEGDYEEYTESGKLLKKGSYKNNKYDGYWIFNDANGLPHMEFVYREGLRNGPFKQYKDGNLVGEGTAINDKPDGELKLYHPNGKLQNVSQYRFGAKVYEELYNDNGSLKAKRTYKDGKLDGIVEAYHPNGHMQYRCNYLNGNLDGEAIFYNSEGKMSQRKFYVEGKVEGELLQYDSYGEIIARAMYKNDKLDGVAENYHTLSLGDVHHAMHDKHQRLILKDRYNYKEGKKHGEYHIYFENGEVCERGRYEEDVREGAWSQRNEDGSPYMVINYWNGKRHGTYLEYENGRVKVRYNYKFGMLNGEQLLYYSNGNLKSREEVVDDVLKSREAYFENGNLHEKSFYLGGSLEGILEEYYESGRLKEKSNYSRGKYHGESESYDESGSLVEKAIYNNGNIAELEEYNSLGSIVKTIKVEGNIRLEKKYYASGELREEQRYDINERRNSIIKYFITGGIKQKEDVVYDRDMNGREINPQKDGECVEYFVTGNKKEEIIFDRGKRIGSSREFYENNNLRYEENIIDEENLEITFWYTNGQIETIDKKRNSKYDGKYTSYYPNGNIKSKTNYVEGKRIGKQEFYFANGQKDSEYVNELDESGKVRSTGEGKWYYPCGGLKCIEVYDKFKLVSTKHFFLNGQVSQNSTYSNNKEESYFYNDRGIKVYETFVDGNKTINIAYTNEGIKRYSDIYMDGKLHGKCFTYYDNGQVRTDIDYVRGARHGKFYWHYENGQLGDETNYLNGQKHGTMKNWYDDGSIEIEASYKNNKYEGLYKEYYKNGQVKKIGYYKDGELVGEEKEYFEDGSLKSYWEAENEDIKETYYELYKNGKLKRIREGKPNEKNSIERLYSEDGVLLEGYKMNGSDLEIESYYENGQIKVLDAGGWRTDYREDGSLSQISKVEENQLHGETFIFGKNDRVIGRYYYANGKLEGTYTKYYESGEVMEDGIFRDGRYYDWITEYYKSGREKAKWRTGNFFSPRVEYYESGAKKSEFVEDEEKKQDYLVEYYEDGSEKKRVEVRTRGEYYFEGKYEEYFEGGSIKKRSRYVNNKLDGEVLSYYKSGVVKEREVYQRGYRVSNKIGYFPDTKIRYEEFYNENLQLEKIVKYGIGGNVSVIEYFVENQISENVELFYPSGKKYGVIPVVEGERSGEAVYYYENGNILLKEIYEEGFLNGDVIEYYENGNIRSKVVFVYGKAEGLKTYFSIDGDIEKTEFYQDGKVVDGGSYN